MGVGGPPGGGGGGGAPPGGGPWPGGPGGPRWRFAGGAGGVVQHGYRLPEPGLVTAHFALPNAALLGPSAGSSR